MESVTGVSVTDAYVDKGYRGHGYAGAANVHVASQGYANRSRAERRRRRRRSAIEPKIGHLKSDHRMNRCFLAGLSGDAINAVLAAAGSNLRKPCPEPRRVLRRLAAALIPWLRLAAALPRWLRIAVRTDGVMLEPTPTVADPRPCLRLCA